MAQMQFIQAKLATVGAQESGGTTAPVPSVLFVDNVTVVTPQIDLPDGEVNTPGVISADGVGGQGSQLLNAYPLSSQAYGVTVGSANLLAAIEASNVDLNWQLQGETVALGSPVYIKNSDGKQYNAIATAGPSSQVVGLSTGTTDLEASGFAIFFGFIAGGVFTMATALWDAIVTGESGGLTTGSYYYLSGATKGFLTTEQPVPDGQWVLKIGVALSPTTMLVQIGTPVENVG